MPERTVGRPKRSSRATLQEAAYELFLERGYDATSVDDIASRAGISRSTFWSYAASKTDLLWLDVDDLLDRMEAALDARSDGVDAVLQSFAATVTAADAPLPLLEVDTMGVGPHLRASAFDRLLRLVAVLESALLRDADSDPRGGAWRRAAELVAAGERWLATSRRGGFADSLRPSPTQ